jgi:ribonuclease P protein component
LPGGKLIRLTDSTEFERVYRQGVAYRGELFALHAFQNELESARLGLSVSKKVGNAVTRNKVRRRLKEIFHELAGESPNADIVVSAKPLSADASFDELRAEFERALLKIKERKRTRG